MEVKQPLIRQGWLRALLFAAVYLVLIVLSNLAIERLLENFGSNQLPGTDTGNLPGIFLLVRVSISLLISVLTVYFFRRLIDKQNLISLGLQIKNHLSNAAAGFSLGLLLLGVGTFILIAGKNLQWTNINIDAAQILTGFSVMVVAAFAEELVFRGYILSNLMLSLNKWLALICSALLFALFHLSNFGTTPIALLNVFIGGILIGINYIYTKNLWFGILFHFAWNFYQGPVLGYKVSGVTLKSIFEQQLTGNAILTGGPFGFEGSVIASVLSLLAIGMLGWIYQKRMINY